MAARPTQAVAACKQGYVRLVLEIQCEMELARLDRLEGSTEIAVDRLEEVMKLLGSRSRPRLEAWTHQEIGLALVTTDPERSMEHFSQTLNLYELQDMHIEVARTHMLIAQQKGLSPPGTGQAYSLAGEAMNKMPDF